MLSISTRFPEEVAVEEIVPYFAGVSFSELAKEVHRYLQPLLDLPCEAQS
jgi:hypothetical protein